MSIQMRKMTEGSELRHILMFSIPLLIGNLFQQVYNITDSIVVGQYLGDDKLAAVGSTSSITFLFYTICNGLSIGAGVLIAQCFGAGRDNDVKKYITNSAYCIGAIGLVVSVVAALLAQPVLSLMGTPGHLLGDATAYMRIAVGGTIAVAAYNWINSVMRSLGDAKTPLIFLIISSLLNVGLDLLFVLVFNWGVSGAAWATVIAQGLSSVLSIGYAFWKNPFFKFNKEHAALNGNMLLRTVKTGVPIALQYGMVSVSMIFLQTIANGFGDTVMAAYTATMRVEQLIQQPFVSLNSAMSAFTGQNAGAGKPERIEKGYRQAIKTCIIFAAAVMVVFLLLNRLIVGCFVSGSETIDRGGSALMLSCLFYPFLGVLQATRGLLNGAGDVGYAFINGLAEVVGRIGFGLILTAITVIGSWAVWGTTCLTWVLTAVMGVIRYKSGRWRTKCYLTQE
ncbi:MAG: MATE family efflux transporter [Eubacterium sp.]|nr:MATE family efflux transporter [Eubacterium sp.]